MPQETTVKACERRLYALEREMLKCHHSLYLQVPIFDVLPKLD